MLCTDSELALTRGNPAGPLVLLSYLDLTRGSFTGVTSGRNGEVALVGQMIYTLGDRSARVSFLLPADNLDQPSLPSLMESLAVQAGSWGACHLLAEVEESSPALDPVRHSGFSVYGWQTIWQVPGQVDGRRDGPWRPAGAPDDVTARTLYQQLVPPLVQAAEPFAPGKGPRLVYRQDDEVLAYAEAVTGPQGIYVQPVIHPAVNDVASLLEGLVAQLPPAGGRPIYMAVRSYQAWLEPVLHRMQALASPRQALLVKHLAVLQRVSLLARQPAREAYNPEASVPLIQNTTIYKN